MGIRASHLLRGLWWLACGTCALVWGYAAWRLAVRPEDCGPLEASVAAGGWGLSVVPVHVTERRPARRFARGLPPAGSRPSAQAEGSGWQRGHQ